MKRRILSMVVAVAIMIAAVPIVAMQAADSQEVLKVTDKLETDETVKNYQFTLAKPGRVSMNFKHSMLNTGFWHIYLYDSTDGKRLEIESSGTELDRKSLTDYLDAGTYTVKVESGYPWEFSDADYTLTVNYTENTGDFEIEYNNAASVANPIEVHKPIIGNMYSGDDLDFYTFTIDKPGRVSMNFKHLILNDGEWHIYLYDSNNVEQLEFYSDRNELDKNSECNYLNAGTYTIQVKHDYPWQWNNADYTLTANYTENTGQFEIEYNNSKSTANPIELNKPIIGNLYSGDDEDFYTFTLSKAERIYINFKHLKLGGDWDIYLYDNNDIEQLDFYSSENDLDKNSETVNLHAGTYTLLVNTRYGGSRADYTLTVSSSTHDLATCTDPNCPICNPNTHDPATCTDPNCPICNPNTHDPDTCTDPNCPICNPQPAFKLGDVDDDGDIDIFDALEVLKNLVGMDGAIKTGTVLDARALNAALITTDAQTNNTPTIFDALEILKKLVKMSNLIDTPIKKK